VSESKNIQELLKQGIEAARAGQKAEARKFFEQAVDLDDQNEKSWMWLASVMDTDEEKRLCLSNVLLLNPLNERAQKAMAQLDAKSMQSNAGKEIIPGVSRRQLMLFGGGGGVVIVLLLVVFLSIQGNRNAAVVAEQQNAQATVDAATAVVAAAFTEIANATATQIAAITPTPSMTPTSPRPSLPPEFTATPSPTPTEAAAVLPPPNGVGGRLITWSGRDVGRTGFLPIVIYQISSGQGVPLPDTQGRNPDALPDGGRVVYTRYFPVTFDYGLEQINTNGTDATILSNGQPVIKAQQPRYCATTNWVVFVALPTGRQIDFNQQQPPYQVFLFNLDTNQVLRLTNDEIGYSEPAFSPDCSKIAVVRNDAASLSIGADIVLIDPTSMVQTAVTNDLDAFTESSPRWSPDGTTLIYAAAPKNDPANHDIVTRPLSDSATPLVVVRQAADDILPVFSPDGRFIAYSSNRNGFWDIYILETATGMTYQLTNTEDEDYPGAWVN